VWHYQIVSVAHDILMQKWQSHLIAKMTKCKIESKHLLHGIAIQIYEY